MSSNDHHLHEQAIQWLKIWRELGKPRLPVSLCLNRNVLGNDAVTVGSSEVTIQFANRPIESIGCSFQSFHVFAQHRNVTELVADLSEMPIENDCLVTMFRGDLWTSMMSVAVAVQAAHCKACWLAVDVEGIRALDQAIVNEQVAALEARILAEQTASAHHGARSRRLRL